MQPVLLFQLGPNPSSVDGQALGRGQSGNLGVNGTLHLVNQSYPFTVQFSDSTNGASSASSSDQKKRKGTGEEESQQKALDCKGKKVQPKRNIQDFFGSSPAKVPVNKFLH